MIIPYGTPFKEKTVIALGYFDAVHIGHIKVLKKAYELAESLGVEPCVLIFTGSKQGEGKHLFTLPERILKISRTNVRNIIIKELDKELAYELVSTNQTVFTNNQGSYIPKDEPVSGLEELLTKYKK